jgi:hemoglobin/transferrin/lactoferrin receptor protein
LAAAAGAHGADAPELGGVVVTATRAEREVDLVAKPVTVVTREDIAARPQVNVQQLLEHTPGVSFSRAGGLGGQLVVRGLNSNDPRLVLFIDGDRFRGRNTLEYNLLDPAEIERIEIVRGPAAALYGSDAMAGLVNVITRRATGDAFQPFRLTPRIASLGYASANDFFGGRVELQGLGNGLDILLGFNYRSAGDYRSPAGTIPNSDFETRGLTARLGWSPDADRRFELIGRLNHVESGRAGGIGGAPGAPMLRVREDPLEESFVRLGYTQRRVASWLESLEATLYRRKLETTITTEDRTAANGNVAFRNSYVLGPVVYGGKLIGRSALQQTLLTFGADFYHEDRPGSENDGRTFNAAGTQIGVIPRAKRNRDVTQLNVGAFVNADWDPAPMWTVSAAGRYDFVRTEVEATPAVGENPALRDAFARNRRSDDDALTGAVGAVLRPWSALHFVANVATAFRTPATFERFSGSVAGAVTTIPNPDLKPERSINYEAGLRVRLPTLTLNLTAFRSDYEDLLQTVMVNPTTRQRQNVGTAEFTGAELDGIYTLGPAWKLRFNASTVRGTNTLTGQPLAYIPPLNGLLSLRHVPADRMFIEATVRASRAKTRIDPAQERPTGGYATFSLHAGADLGSMAPSLRGVRLAVGIENLFDRKYVNPVTFANVRFPPSITNPLVEPGRSVVVNIATTF